MCSSIVMSVFLFLETLRNYFSQYGEVVDCVIMKDKTTNQSRGFGFVKFKDPNCVRTVLETKPHNLDGRNVSTSPAKWQDSPISLKNLLVFSVTIVKKTLHILLIVSQRCWKLIQAQKSFLFWQEMEKQCIYLWGRFIQSHLNEAHFKQRCYLIWDSAATKDYSNSRLIRDYFFRLVD